MEIEYQPWQSPKYEGVEISRCGKVKQNGIQRRVYHMVKTKYMMAQLQDLEGRWRLEYLHRMLCQTYLPNPNNHRIIDHIDRNRLNNDLTNLRWVSYNENNVNRPLHKNNTTGFRGVSRSGDKFVAKMGNKWLGCFNTAQEAGQRYIEEVQLTYPNIVF